MLDDTRMLGIVSEGDLRMELAMLEDGAIE